MLRLTRVPLCAKKKIQGFLNRALGKEESRDPLPAAKLKPTPSGKYSLRNFQPDDSLVTKGEKFVTKRALKKIDEPSKPVRNFPTRPKRADKQILTEDDLTRVNSDTFDWDSVNGGKK
jgi:hypothetical protein